MGAGDLNNNRKYTFTDKDANQTDLRYFYITYRGDAGKEVLLNVYDRSGGKYPGGGF
jgi:hypothetical protein